jgi:ankyrin repeat protein
MKNSSLICQSVNVPIDIGGNVALHLTVSQNDHFMTCVLLLKGADPNIANRSGVMPLMIAQRMGFTRIVKVLLQCGAIETEKNDPIAVNRRKSIIDHSEAERSGQILNHTQGLFGSFSASKPIRGQTVEVIDEDIRDLVQVSMETGVMILPDAAYLGFQEPLLSVLRTETLIDTDDEGATILMKAAYRGHFDLVKELLNRGIDPDAMDKNGNTAMVWAVLGGKAKVAKLIFEMGGSIDGAVPNCMKIGVHIKGQLTPLIAAAYYGHNNIVEFLVKEKCDVNLRVGSGKGKSALMVAAWARRKETVKILLLHRAYVDANVDEWLTKGIIQLKKLLKEKNPWMDNALDNIPHRKDQTSNNQLNQINASRRASLQDKFVYFSSEDNDVTAEITGLLSARAGVPVSQLNSNQLDIVGNNSQISLKSQTRSKRISGMRQGMNLDKIIGNNSDSIMVLAEQLPSHGTELDGLWISLFQCVVQLIMAANKNIKHHYVAISAKAVHSSAEIVRAIENCEKKAIVNGIRFESFCDTLVKQKIRDLSKTILSEFPKQLMISTRLAIGVWPPPNAVSEMIKEAANLASICRELVLLANTLGAFPISDKKFDISFQPFEETNVQEEHEGTATQEKDSSLKGGLSYSEYKRQNDLKLIEEMSKKVDIGPRQASQEWNTVDTNETENDDEFFSQLDKLSKEFAQSVSELKHIHDQHLVEDFIKATSTVHERADTLMEEIQSYELLKEFSDDITLTLEDVQKIESKGVKLGVAQYPVPLKHLYCQCFDDVRSAAKIIMARGKIASSRAATSNATQEMLNSTIPCILAIKKLVLITKEATVRVRAVGIEERRKREELRKERMANKRTKQLFQMWESQVLNDALPSNKRNMQDLSEKEAELLEDGLDGIVFEGSGPNSKVKGGRLSKLVELLTSHAPNLDEDFMPTFLMTHHSFTTSAVFMDFLFKRYEISPPPGLNQRLFEIFVDKKVVQVRLKVCHVLLYWIQNHFEDDFVDNEYLILRFRDFIGKTVIHDFEQMAVQILNELEHKLLDHESSKIKQKPLIEKKEPAPTPKPLLSSLRFGVDPIESLNSDPKAFFDIDPLEMARQLTIIEHELYCKVQAYECTDQIWESHYRKEVAQSKQPKPTICKRHTPGSPNSDISRLIQHTNDFTFWVATWIINHDNLKNRINAVKYFIQMAQVFKTHFSIVEN